MNTSLHASQCLKQSWHLMTAWMVLPFYHLLQWWYMDSVYHPETKRQPVQWTHPESPPPNNFLVTTSTEKIVIAMFSNNAGVILTHFVSKGTRIRLQPMKTFRKRSFFQYCNKMPGKERFHEDKASPQHPAGPWAVISYRQLSWSGSSTSVLITRT